MSTMIERMRAVHRTHRLGLALVAMGLGAGALAQESTSFKLKEFVFNAAGHPTNGSFLSSTSYRVTLDALGEGLQASAVASDSFQLDGGFAPAYPPPTEVRHLRLLADKVMLHWDPERSVGSYNLYRDLLSALPGLGYGSCQQQDITVELTGDADQPPTGRGYFYLVTAENRLAEEGTKGFNSAGAERPNPAPCP